MGDRDHYLEGQLPPPVLADETLAEPEGEKLPANYVDAPPPPKVKEKKTSEHHRLSLRDRLAQSTAQSAEHHQTIAAVIRKTRTPWGGSAPLSAKDVESLEKALAVVQKELRERERLLQDTLGKLDAREKEIRRMEELLAAREQVIAEAKKGPQGDTLSPQQAEALQRLSAEIDKREEELKAMQEMLNEREAFLDESENTLFEKMQAQQERETELDQREADLDHRAAHAKQDAA